MNPISRRSTVGGSAAIASGGTKTAPIDLRGMGGGGFKVPSDWDGGASVTFEIARDPQESGDFALLHDADDAVISQAVTADRWYPFPEDVMKAGAVQLVAASAVGGDRTITWTLKA